MKYVKTCGSCKSKKQFAEYLRTFGFSFWNDNRIKALTNFGNGTFNGWVEFARRNNEMYCTYDEYVNICIANNIKIFPFECNF